ncbi:unnamed protein product [Lathyrus sativus]|nr:unnamed protein product [Lathyrus sativus]
MEGLIPPAISLLKNLKELRISYLKGNTTMTFPDLKDLKRMTRLELRNCLITGPILDSIGKMESLKTLDLSSNRLTGLIPDSFENLENINFMFLTNNSLSGTTPEWILTSKQNFDLSFNNFSESSSTDCQPLAVNLASSVSPSANTSLSFLKTNLPCSGKSQYHSLFINCGGPAIEFDDKEYEVDEHHISAYV